MSVKYAKLQPNRYAKINLESRVKIAYAWQQNVSISITETCHH